MDPWDNRWDKDLDDELWQSRGKSYLLEEEDEEPFRPKRKKAGARKFSLDFLSKSQKQTIIAVLLFLVVLSAKYGDDPASGAVYKMFETALSSQNDYSMALSNMAKGLISGDKLVSVSKGQGTMLLPLNGNVVNGFGWYISPLDQEKRFNAGIDIAAPLGSYIQAPEAGTVLKVGSDTVLGRYVKLDHGNGLTSLLANFGEFSVRAGQKVKKGDRLGTLGFSSAVKKPWLHWEVRRKDQPVDPQSLLSKATKT